MKKLLSIILVAMMVLSLFSLGLADGVEKNVKLTMGIWDVTQQPGMEKMVEKFTEMNPTISVEVQVTPWDEYWTKMEAAATGGAMPDVFWMHTNEFAKYAGNDMLMPLDDVIKTDKFSEALVSLATYSNGILYGVPKDFDTIALGFNKELFDAAEIAYPDETWTWETFLDAAQKLTNAETNTWGFLAPLEDQVGYLPFVYQAGGSVIENKTSNIDSKESKAGLQFYVDLINKEKVSPTLAELTDTHFMEIFQAGRAGMALVGSWHMGSYTSNEDFKGKFDIAPLPKDVRQATMINGLSFAGSAKTEHPEEVKVLLQFLASEEAQTIQAESGTAISAFEGTSEKWIGTYPDYNVKVFLDSEAYAFPVPTSNTKSKWGNTMTEMIKKMMMDEMTVEEGTAVIAQNMNELLASE